MMTAVPVFDRSSRQRTPITSFPGDESEFVARFQNPHHHRNNNNNNSDNKNSNPCSTTMDPSALIGMSNRSSSDSQLTAPTAQMSDRSLVDGFNDDDMSPTTNGSLSSGTGSNSNSSSNSGGSLSGRYLSNAIESARTSFREFTIEQGSVEAPYNKTPYVIPNEQTPGMTLEPYPQPQDQRQEREQRDTRNPKQSSSARRGANKPQRPEDETSRTRPAKKLHDKTNRNSRSVAPKKSTPHQQPRTPKVTGACVPFEKTVPPTSCLRDELAKDPAYRHALKAGTLWQSLVGQHVKLPPLWFDGSEPARPYLGCEDPLKRNKWSYFGRHRVAGDPKLNALVRHGNSSGKLLLHIVGRDSDTLAPTEDIVVGVFHPNAEAPHDTAAAPQKRHEDCRDVWIGHRSRSVPHRGRRIATRIESLLRYLHRNTVDTSPLGGGGNNNNNNNNKNTKRRIIDNSNIAMVFGSRPPRHTLFVPEDELYELLQPPPPPPPPQQQQQHPKAGAPPASVVLLRAFLR